VDFAFTEEQRLVREMVGGWASRSLAPVAAELSREERFPAEQLAQMAELGLMGMLVPERHGGSDTGAIAYALAVLEVAKACASTAVAMAVTNMVAEAIARDGTPAQIGRYLSDLASGRLVAGAFALSEPGSGSDAAAITTTAVRDGDSYVLNGTKVFCTNGSHAGVVILFARTNSESKAGGVTAFLVEPSFTGYTVLRTEDKMGLRASDTAMVQLEDCRVPLANRFGAEGQGFKVAMRALDSGRIGVAAQALGIGCAALEASARYAQERRQFDRQISSFQAIQWKLADMATELEAAEKLMLRAAWLKESGSLNFRREAAMAKLFASEAAYRACDEAVQIHGGYGYTRDFPVERLLRDVRVTRIYEGASEVQRIVIAREVLAE
jgi:alkylation response protein AidB-like acyl-CoA dehydrogenase